MKRIDFRSNRELLCYALGVLRCMRDGDGIEEVCEKIEEVLSREQGQQAIQPPKTAASQSQYPEQFGEASAQATGGPYR